MCETCAQANALTLKAPITTADDSREINALFVIFEKSEKIEIVVCCKI